MTSDGSTLIGILTDVGENEMTATMERMEGVGFPVVEIDGDPLAVGQIGTYLIIRQGQIQVVAMVLAARQDRRSPEKLREPESAERYRGVMKLVPLGELDVQLNFQRGIVHYPTPGAEVHLARRREVEALFKKHRARGYELGYLPSRPSITLCLDPSLLFGRHLAILGQSGSGKSWGVASLLQRAVATMPNAHIILLDLHGEYVWADQEGKRQSAFDESIYRYLDARELEIPYWLLTYSELVDLLIDRSDKSASTQMAFLREVLLVLRRKANKDMEEANISIDSPVYFSLVELYHQFKRANEQVTDFGKVKGPLYGQFDEFLIKIQARFNDVRYDFLFKPKRRRTSATLSDLLRDFVGLKDPKRQITVVDFSPVPFDVRPTLSAQVGRLAFEFNYWNPRSREFPILLMCEEAHAYIPRGADTQYEGTRRSMERIAKEGRKYGVGLAVVSQRPHELSETVLAQCGNFICLRVTNPDDQQYIRDLVPDAESGLVDILSALGRGEAMAMGESVPLPTRFQFYRPNPPPNSSDVDFYGQWREGPQDFDVEAIADRWRRQGR
jgi:DNA helicase HerA-like ATPase